MAERPECELHLVLSGECFVSSAFDSSAGLKRKLSVEGEIHEYPIEGVPESAFHGKSVMFAITSPPDSKLLATLASELAAGPCCGTANVRAGVEPEPLELDGETQYDAPVRIHLHAEEKDFEAVTQLVLHGQQDRKLLQADVTLVGSSLPEPESRIPVIWPYQLDVTNRAEYAVSKFEVSVSMKDRRSN